MTNKTFKTYQTKRFIAEFNFPDPDWDNLPVGFPRMPEKDLTREECHLLDAIKLAYFAEKGWKKSAARSTRIGLISLICLISLIGLIRLASHGQGSFTQPVQAATLKVNEVIESTMSAILKR